MFPSFTETKQRAYVKAAQHYSRSSIVCLTGVSTVLRKSYYLTQSPQVPWKQKVVQAIKGFCICLESGHASWEDQVCIINADLTQEMAWKLPMAERPDRTAYKNDKTPSEQNDKTPSERKGLCILRKINSNPSSCQLQDFFR